MCRKFLVTLIAAVLIELSSANSNNQEDAKNVSVQGLLTSELDGMVLGVKDSNGEVRVAEDMIITLESQVPSEEEEDGLELTEDEDNRSKNETTRAIFYAGEDGLTRHSSKVLLCVFYSKQFLNGEDWTNLIFIKDLQDELQALP